MNLLIDTHVLLWWIQDSKQLGKRARALIRDNATSIWVSSVSIWEISIKTALGKLDQQELNRKLEQNGFRPLSITWDHALAVRDLPLHHRDPFDRILIAQSIVEDLTLMTADAAIQAYDVRTIDAAR